MKRILVFVLGFILTCFGATFAAPTNNTSQGLTFSQGMNSKKPMIVLLYAPWSQSTERVIKNMASLKRVYGTKANIISLDIASPDAKYYNAILPIQPNLPHIIMFKDKAKISKYVSKDCALDYACLSKRVESFVR